MLKLGARSFFSSPLALLNTSTLILASSGLSWRIFSNSSASNCPENPAPFLKSFSHKLPTRIRPMLVSSC